MLYRGENSQQMPINIVGSCTFGRYAQVSVESTMNMFISDEWLVNYAGYEIAIPAAQFNITGYGRAIYASANFGKLIIVIGAGVFFVEIKFDQKMQRVVVVQVTLVGELQTTSGIVYISENNKPQILFSDNHNLYIYDSTLSPKFKAIEDLDFIPGYIDFHDTYFLAAVRNSSNWRLSNSNEGSTAADWPNAAANVGALETKPDEVQAVIRVPGKGNMIMVFGKTVVEAWFDVGAALFPYQRNTGFNSDYGCINPATIARLDEMVVWLAINERSGPVIMYSMGLNAQAITTDGIDYLFSNLQNPEDSQGFIFRQDGHILYHINFYTDNISLFYDFNTKKFFYASDEKLNYFIASEVAFFDNQYYFISRNNGNLYAFDTIFTTYDGEIIPRIRTCKNIRLPTQDYFITTDVGFTIESGDTDYYQQNFGDINLITEDGKDLITEGTDIFFETEDDELLVTEDDVNLVSEQVDPLVFNYLIAEQSDIRNLTPRVDMSISTDGGEHFSSYVPQVLPRLGVRKNKLMWWQLGSCNNLTLQFRFYGIGRFVATDGVANIRI